MATLTAADVAQLKAAGRPYFHICMVNKTIDVRTAPMFHEDEESKALGFADKDSGEPRPYFVSVAGPLRVDQKKAFAEAVGVPLGQYMPLDSFITVMTVNQAHKALTVPRVQWVGAYLPSYKYSRGTNEPGVDAMIVQLFPASDAATRELVDRWNKDAPGKAVFKSGSSTMVSVTIGDPSKSADVAAFIVEHPRVMTVEVKPQMRLLKT